MKQVIVTLLVSLVNFPVLASEYPLTEAMSVPLQGVEGRIDHLAADITGKRVFIAALGNNSIEVVDLASGTRTKSISGFSEPQGICYDPESDRLFIACGGDGNCKVLDGQTFKTIATIPLGEDADNVRYDSNSHRVFIGHGRGALAIFDAKTGARLDEIHLSGHPESFQIETNGNHLFVNIPSMATVAEVDLTKKKVAETWVPRGTMNFPMALDETNHRLFIGCRHPAKVLVYSTSSGKFIADVDIGADADDIFYDPFSKSLFVSCGSGSVDVIEQLGPDTYRKKRSKVCGTGARTSLFIPELETLCVAVPHRNAQSAKLLVFRTR